VKVGSVFDEVSGEEERTLPEVDRLSLEAASREAVAGWREGWREARVLLFVDGGRWGEAVELEVFEEDDFLARGVARTEEGGRWVAKVDDGGREDWEEVAKDDLRGEGERSCDGGRGGSEADEWETDVRDEVVRLRARGVGGGGGPIELEPEVDWLFEATDDGRD
jgi:hypothetical protein